MFPCEKWLARDEDDGETVRELPAMGENVEKPPPISVDYKVHVFTGNKWGSGTDANVRKISQ